jgi:hypothetical protein
MRTTAAAYSPRKTFFTMFIDRMFTTFIERAFTNARETSRK